MKGPSRSTSTPSSCGGLPERMQKRSRREVVSIAENSGCAAPLARREFEEKHAFQKATQRQLFRRGLSEACPIFPVSALGFMSKQGVVFIRWHALGAHFAGPDAYPSAFNAAWKRVAECNRHSTSLSPDAVTSVQRLDASGRIAPSVLPRPRRP